MSGHSKWSTIKRRKGAEDAKRGKVFTRIAREITTAVRDGGKIIDPNMNPRLRLAMDKARAANMPKDNIERAVNRGAGIGDEEIQFEEITYEGYGPGGVAIIIDTVTDNRNRTLSEVKHALTRSNGSLANTNAVLWQFDQKGYIELDSDGVNFDDLFLTAADAGAEDVIDEEGIIMVYTPRNDLHTVANALSEAGYSIKDSYLTWVPKNEMQVEPDQAVQVIRLIEKLEELDDIQNVSSNLNLTAEALTALENA